MKTALPMIILRGRTVLEDCCDGLQWLCLSSSLRTVCQLLKDPTLSQRLKTWTAAIALKGKDLAEFQATHTPISLHPTDVDSSSRRFRHYCFYWFQGTRNPCGNSELGPGLCFGLVLVLCQRFALFATIARPWCLCQYRIAFDITYH